MLSKIKVVFQLIHYIMVTRVGLGILILSIFEVDIIVTRKDVIDRKSVV